MAREIWVAAAGAPKRPRVHFRTWWSLFVAGALFVTGAWERRGVTGAMNRSFSTCGAFADFVAGGAL